jgi:ATP-dependent helicase/nuclease subunit B
MPRLIHLGWDGPALPRAAEFLRERFEDDFDGVTIALPGARAGRRLEELLIGLCRPSWAPPHIATIGPITDALVRFSRPRAGGLAREIAWVEALQALPPAALAALCLHPPATQDFTGWTALAGQVRALHQELAAEHKRFADLPGCALLPVRERARWQALAQAQELYADLIARCGWCDPHLERLRVLESQAPLRAPRALVLVGIAAVNGLQKELLQRAAAQGVEVLALIVAPESEAAGFDEYGFVRTEAWNDRAVPLDDARWRVADRPADQAEEVVSFLEAACGGQLDGRASVAVLQEEVTPFLARRLTERGSGLRPPLGRMVSETAPGRLLDALRAYLEGREPRALAALVRHPDLAARLALARDPGAACDEYLHERLPSRMDPGWAPVAELERLCGALAGAELLPLDAWPQEIGKLMKEVFAQRLEREDEAGVEKISAALEEVAALPEPLAEERVGAADFLRLVMHACGRETLAPDVTLRGLEQLGWLELTLDEAPALAVAGFQLGTAPEAVHGHPFLPESLRVALGLPTNDDRRARDVWALHVLGSVREALLCVSGQRGTAGDPWLPSPLVFQGADAAARVRAFFRAPAALAATTAGATSPWAPPTPPAPAPRAVESFSASQLTAYHKSPRLYWLQRELGLQTVDPEPHEMDALRFGNFAHELLAEFHLDPDCAQLRGAEAIGGVLRKRLREQAERRFGRRPLAAVRLQLVQLAGRLTAWAEHEALSRAQGWVTVAAEWEVTREDPVRCEIEGEQFALHGRLDRVDRRERDGRVEIRVLDYKSGDQPTLAKQAFMPKAQRWVDLQLPVYRKIAEAAHPGAAVTLGWFNLPRAAEGVGIAIPTWKSEALQAAEAAILAAVRGIRAGRFEEVRNPDRRYLSPTLLTLLGEAPLDPESIVEEDEETAA